MQTIIENTHPITLTVYGIAMIPAPMTEFITVADV